MIVTQELKRVHMLLSSCRIEMKDAAAAGDAMRLLEKCIAVMEFAEKQAASQGNDVIRIDKKEDMPHEGIEGTEPFQDAGGSR